MEWDDSFIQYILFTAGTAYTKEELCALRFVHNFNFLLTLFTRRKYHWSYLIFPYYSSEIFRKHKIIVLSDEIYGQLTYSGNHIPLSKVSYKCYMKYVYLDILYVTNSFSDKF